MLVQPKAAQRRARPKASRRLLPLVLLVLLLAQVLLMLLPVLLVAVNALKSEAEYSAVGPLGLPRQLTLENLVHTWDQLEYPTKLWNSVLISTATALLAIGLSLLNAFALGIGRMRGRSLLLVMFLLGIMLPNEALAYPLYYMFKFLGLYDTRLAVILILSALHSAFGTYLLTSVYSEFPRELIEAAMLDGCSKVQLLTKITIPISLPTLSVLFVFFFIWTWNEFFIPLIFLISNAKQTVPLALTLLRGQYGMDVTMQAAAGLLGVLPCLLFFLLFQRTLTRGITAGSIK